eukprot:145081-Chlamydomonas_euryale.AAC.1
MVVGDVVSHFLRKMRPGMGQRMRSKEEEEEEVGEADCVAVKGLLGSALFSLQYQSSGIRLRMGFGFQ